MRWEITPRGKLRSLCCARVGNPTYISEFGCNGHFVVRRLGMRAALWDAWRLGLGRGFGMRVSLWDEGLA